MRGTCFSPLLFFPLASLAGVDALLNSVCQGSFDDALPNLRIIKAKERLFTLFLRDIKTCELVFLRTSIAFVSTNLGSNNFIVISKINNQLFIFKHQDDQNCLSQRVYNVMLTNIPIHSCIYVNSICCFLYFLLFIPKCSDLLKFDKQISLCFFFFLTLTFFLFLIIIIKNNRI